MRRNIASASAATSGGRDCIQSRNEVEFFFVLQVLQQTATLKIECAPPREIGSRWSIDLLSAVSATRQ